MYRARLLFIGCFTGFPLCTYSHFYFAIIIYITCSYAYVVIFSKVFNHHKPLPVPIAIPHKLFFIRQQNIGFFIAINISYRHSISYRYIVINCLRLKFWDWFISKEKKKVKYKKYRGHTGELIQEVTEK